MLRTLFFYVTFYPFTLFCSVLTVFCSFLGADSAHRIASFWGRGTLPLAGIRMRIEGEENIPTDGPVIYMANHASNFDIPSLYAGLHVQFRWLAKKELFDIPFFGAAMRRAGYIAIDRSDRRNSLLSLKKAAERIRAGASVVIFPEGTRSPDGQLLPFKRGGFTLAVQSEAPIVPVVILGTRSINPKGSLTVHGGDVRLRFLPPIATTGATSRDQDPLADRVREAMTAVLTEEQSGAGA